MRYLIYSLVLTCCSAFATEQRSFNSTIKHKLSFEVGALDLSLSAAKNEATQLRQDKADIDIKLQNMEDWGNDQEKQKNSYYAQLVVKTNEVSKVQAKLDLEKENSKTTIIRYHRVKSLLGYLAGLVAAGTYIALGSNFVTAVASVVAGPWAFALRWLGPALAFTLGYLTINIVF